MGYPEWRGFINGLNNLKWNASVFYHGYIVVMSLLYIITMNCPQISELISNTKSVNCYCEFSFKLLLLLLVHSLKKHGESMFQI